MDRIYFTVNSNTKIIDWLLPWRARRIILELRSKNEKMHAQSEAMGNFVKIRHGLDMLPRIALKTPIER